MSANPFNKAQFMLGATNLAQLPPDEGREIAFAGRSNVGKSSVINTLANHGGLARTSKTPGRTQQLNCFQIDAVNRWVDLPGYGYARVPEQVKRHWGVVLQSYFSERRSLYGLFLIMDIRHPLKPFDNQLLDWCASKELQVHILLNKADKLTRGAANQTLKNIQQKLENEHFSLQLFSVTAHTGLEQARTRLSDWLLPDQI